MKKKLNMNKYDISCTKSVTRKFHVVVVQNKGKEMYKKVCSTCKVAFLLIRPIVVSPFSLPSPLKVMLHRTTLLRHCFDIATLFRHCLRHCFEGLQHCSSIATLCCGKNRRCESSSVTLPLALHDFSSG